MKRVLVSTFAMCLAALCLAQMPQDYLKKTEKALQVGDLMPDYTFPSVSQYPVTTIRLSELKGKVVILDFWGTFCSSCIDFFPHLQQIQDQFKDQVQVIAADDYFGDSWEKINKTLGQFKKHTGNKVDFPFALFDSTLYSYFPHKSSSYGIIIDRKGKIIATTFAEEITPEKIQAILDGKDVHFSVKDDFLKGDIPFVSYLNKNNKDGILISSSLMKYRPLQDGFTWGSQYDDKGHYIGIRLSFSLLGAYMEAYPSTFSGGLQIQYETKDTLFDVDWYHPESKLFMYDWIIQPGKGNDSLYRTSLRADLEKVFNFSLRRSKAMFSCLIVRTNQNISKSYTKLGTSAQEEGNLSTYKSATRNHIAVYDHKVSLEDLVNAFNGAFKTVKLINETTLGKQKLDIDFPVGFDLTDPVKIKAFLATKGIELSVENRELDCVIVSDKKPGEPTVIN